MSNSRFPIPIIVIFMIALLVACLQNKAVKFEQKIELMGKVIGDKNIVTMLLIFLTAGIFVGVMGRSSASSVAYFMLSLIPAQYSVVILFIVSCFVSISMGTSVGTITLVTPISIAVAETSGLPVTLCVASVISGAMFGDNLSFISDTTIAACNGQGCKMKDKFFENFFIACPAAFLTIVIIFVISLKTEVSGTIQNEYSLIQIVPYVLVLIFGILGFNVFLILIIGIVTGSFIMIFTGAFPITQLLANMGNGASGMFETAMVAILVSAISALISEYGGFDALLLGIKKVFKGKKAGQLGIGLLVGAMDIATANNTVAIVMSNPIAKEISESYGISAKRTASILDTFSCVFQGLIPYGAQLLIAISTATGMGYAISAFDIMPYLIYPYLLGISQLIFIFFVLSKEDR